MGWGTSWGKFATEPKEYSKEAVEVAEKLFSEVDLAAGPDQTVLTTFEDGQLKHRITEPGELYNNLKPTHDPYTNPGAFLYYECECGQILDPKTKRFAELNNCASEKGWKIRWGSQHYIPYCPKCVEAKGIE